MLSKNIFFLIFLLFCTKEAIGAEYRIATASDFKTFVNEVNSGTNYSGTTVLLDSDLSLSGESLKPINGFLGIFDSQGYFISNLKVSSSSQYAGLFGYSKGLTIRNVVLDSSCVITNSYIGSDNAYIGGIIGYCHLNSGQCNIENNVNMVGVTFDGKIASNYLYLGGIAGYLYINGYCGYVKNCANYGTITHAGTSKEAHVGGIVGSSYSSSSKYNYIYNCFNYGTVTHSGTTSDYLFLGGILGYSSGTSIESCVSAGKITSTGTATKDFIGSIATAIVSYTHIENSFWSKSLGCYIHSYTSYSPEISNTLQYDSTSFELSGDVSIGSYTGNSLIEAINAAADYYSSRDYSKWLLNKDSKTVTFSINSRTNSITMNCQVILLPSLANEGYIFFDGWYTDSEYTKPLESFEIDENTKLYSKFEKTIYTITFDTRREGVSVASKSAQYGTNVSLPSKSIRDYCAVAYWENQYGDNVGLSITMPEYDITLYAVWDCTHLATPEDFVDFFKAVNSGTDDFSGTTVLLDSDLSLSGETLEPISDYDNQFRGTFDGQGHIISDLKIDSDSEYTGLFGYSEGLTIRNVVLDSSCSITSSYSDYRSAYAGGIIGECSRNCNIENNVNMANVSFGGNTNSDFYIGGIAGYLSFSSYVENCANYGSIKHPGTSYDTYIGGIVGFTNSYRYYVRNCINYGAITHNGITKSTLYLGGILGRIEGAYIENCVSAGEISTPIIIPTYSYVGTITGYIEYGTMNYCYSTSQLMYPSYGEGTPTSKSYVLDYNTGSFLLIDDVSVGSYTGRSLIGALNAYSDYYLLRDYSKWLLNKKRKSVDFTIDSRTSPITMDYKIILLPSLASEGNTFFDGWYNDSEYTHPLESFEITEDTMLYGKVEKNVLYTITLETGREGVHFAPITAQFGAVVSLPSESERELSNLMFWETEYGYNFGFSLTMPARNFTLYAVWNFTHLTTPEDLADFSKSVNSGANYSGITVYLDSDLSLAGKTLEPIGNDTSNFFNGVFDGQGHTISDLKMISSYYYTGLFGYSEGLTIRNVVLDSSCSITSTFKSGSSGSNSAWVGGIIGECAAKSGECNIENNVNMAGVSFSGDTEYYLYLGGIAGDLLPSYYNIYVKNCANYAPVTNSGTSEKTYIGGTVGYIYSSGSYSIYIWNCLNYGTITYNGTTSSSDLYLGGILGSSYYTYIKNCVSAGKISAQNTPSYDHVGSIVGYVDSDTHIDNCYYTDNVNESSLYGYAHGIPSIEGTPTSPSTVDSGLIYDLNTCASTNEWNKWLYNEYKASVPFIVLYGKGFALDSQIVLLPDPTGGSERTFNGWYLDFDLTSLFTSDQVDTEITLYGVLCASSYVVTLDVNGGDELGKGKNEMTVRCNGYYETFPTPTKTGYRFAGWFTKSEGGNKIETGDKITRLYNHTLYAHWLGNNQYLVMFDVNGGDDLADDNIIVTFDSPYGTLPNADRTGYDFYGWYTEREGGVRIKSSTVVSTSSDHTLYACWYGKGLTVTLDVNGGEKLSTTTMEVTFNSPYGTFPVPTREGYMFMGWLTSSDEVVKDGSIVSTPSDHTLYAQWDTPTKLVEVVFNETYMTKEDVEKIVKERVDNEVKFTVMNVDRISISESMAVVKFKNINDAKEFVEAIVLGESDDVIKKVGFDHNDSLSLPLYPILSFILMLLWA